MKIPEAEFEQRIQGDVERRQRPSTAEMLRKNPSVAVIVDSSQTPEWNTSRDIVELVIAVRGEIDLDPCSDYDDAWANVPAHQHYTEKTDGLAHRWECRVYMNSPYGDGIERCSEKIAASFASGAMTEGVALVPERTDTNWFQLFAGMPVCFIKGRLKFWGCETGATFRSALFHAGHPKLNAYALPDARGRGTIYVPYQAYFYARL